MTTLSRSCEVTNAGPGPARRTVRVTTTTPVPAPWAQAIAQWTKHLRAGGKRRETIYTYRQRLERTARHLGVMDPWAVTGEELLDYFGEEDGWEVETRRGHRTSVRVFYACAEEKGHVDRSPALVLPKVKPAVPNPMPAPDSVYHPALADADARERLILRLAAEHGLRRGEVAVVHRDDLIEDLLGWSLLVHGKGGKTRVVPLLDEVAALLRALPRGHAFPGAVDGHMSARWCGTLANRLLPGTWTIHKLRHRAATEWWEASDHDLLLVAELLGHASTETTRRYVKAAQDRHRDVVRLAAATAEARTVRRAVSAAA